MDGGPKLLNTLFQWSWRKQFGSGTYSAEQKPILVLKLADKREAWLEVGKVCCYKAALYIQVATLVSWNSIIFVEGKKLRFVLFKISMKPSERFYTLVRKGSMKKQKRWRKMPPCWLFSFPFMIHSDSPPPPPTCRQPLSEWGGKNSSKYVSLWIKHTQSSPLLLLPLPFMFLKEQLSGKEWSVCRRWQME